MVVFPDDEVISVPCQDCPNWETPNSFLLHNILSYIACLIKLKPTLVYPRRNVLETRTRIRPLEVLYRSA